MFIEGARTEVLIACVSWAAVDRGEMMQSHRFRILTVVVGLVVVLGGVAIGQGTDLFPPGDVDPPPAATESIREVGPDVCGPLMRAFQTKDMSVDLVGDYGLVADRVPAEILGLGVRSFSCLSDNLAGRIEMTIISLGRDTEVAQLVIPHAEMSDGAIRSYLSETVPGGTFVEVDPVDSRILVVTAAGGGVDIGPRMLKSPPVPVWEAIIQARS